MENQQRKQQKVPADLQAPTCPTKDVGGNKVKVGSCLQMCSMSGGRAEQRLPFQIKLQQVDLIAELKRRQVSPLVREGKDGAIEDIITGTSPPPRRR